MHLASNGIICNVTDFKVGVKIISSHMALLAELGNITEQDVSTRSEGRPHTQTHTLQGYLYIYIYI
jgi:hypothetical protein